MTGLGRYERGMAMEAEGLSASVIANRLGYPNKAAWSSAKNYYSKKQAAFNARAAGVEAVMPEPLPDEPIDPKIAQQLAGVVDEAQMRTEGDAYKVKPAFKKTVRLEGRYLEVEMGDKATVIQKRGGEDCLSITNDTLDDTVDELMRMLKELKVAK